MSAWPRTLNDAPMATNTIEKPAMNASECAITRQRSVPRVADPWSCSTDIPVMKDRYEGNSGSTHGERNEKIPAENATTRETFRIGGPALLL